MTCKAVIVITFVYFGCTDVERDSVVFIYKRQPKAFYFSN